ncbi:MAG TPA: ADP-ribosylation factor-like protein [Methanoregulaceae archaeon]|nr:ADP-ribosylation factor-like protein [Methanoregulaceae archaeon]
MIRTGITGIDEILGSGIPKRSRILYSMEPGVDGRLFMITTFHEALTSGLRCLVITPTSTADVFREEIISVKGMDIDNFGEHILILDSTERERINNNFPTTDGQLSEWKRVVKSVCSSHAIDVIFVYFDLLHEDFGLENGLGIFDLKEDDCHPVVVVEHLNMEGDRFISDIQSNIYFDLIITLKSAYTVIPFFHFFTLEYVSWSNIPRRSIPYVISEGSIRLYIPKIIVTGPPFSGKSTFVSNACEHGISVDRSDLEGFRTTVAMDLGWLHLKGFDISIYGTPGQPRFDPILPQLFRNAMGVVLVIDVTKPDNLDRARQLLIIAQDSRIPIVVAANKSDLPHQMDRDMIRTMLNLQDDSPVFFISSLRVSEVCHVIESMVEKITMYSY